MVFVKSERFCEVEAEKKTMKSSFARTCDLLNQYMKEKKQLGISNMIPLPTTMDLLPRLEITVESAEKRETQFDFRSETAPKSSQMTIFYNGEVMVFDELPLQKAQEIMLFASQGSLNSSDSSLNYTAANHGMNPHKDPGTVSTNNYMSCIPMARKASLQRFLEKRKDRVVSRAPYQCSGSYSSLSSSKKESKSWLSLTS